MDCQGRQERQGEEKKRRGETRFGPLRVSASPCLRVVFPLASSLAFLATLAVVFGPLPTRKRFHIRNLRQILPGTHVVQ